MWHGVSCSLKNDDKSTQADAVAWQILDESQVSDKKNTPYFSEKLECAPRQSCHPSYHSRPPHVTVLRCLSISLWHRTCNRFRGGFFGASRCTHRRCL